MVVELLTFKLHPCLEALVEPACGALLPGGYGDGTGGAPQTHVVLLVLHGALEEALAALTGEDPVVKTTDFVAAHGTRAGKSKTSRERETI